MTDTDELLGEALRALDTPEHHPEFQRELRTRLAAAQRRPRRLRVAAGAGALVAAAAAVVIVFGLRGGDAANAAVVQAHVRSALASLETLSGELIASGTGQGATKRWQFTLDRRGDLRVVGPEKGDVETYDAVRLIARSAQHSASIGGSTLFYAERRGAPPGRSNFVLPEQFGTYVRTALADGDPQLRSVTFDGRPAWRLLVKSQDVEVTIDRTTWLPVEVDDLRHHRSIRVGHLVVNRPVPAKAFMLAFPAGADVMRSNEGFRRARLADAPLEPGWVPKGYRLAAATRNGDVWLLSYRRAFDQLIIDERGSSPAVSVVGDATAAELAHVKRSLHR
jgi:hypothetical protein